MHWTNKTTFTFLTITSALLISICAAYYSIVGIASLFSGAMISVCIMAVTLELGKLISVSYLFRFWKETKTFLRIYLLIAVFLLMAITSAGIFGYLSYAYQKSALQYSTSTLSIQLQQSNKKSVLEKIQIAQKRIAGLNDIIGIQETRISDMINNPMFTKDMNGLKDTLRSINEIIDKNKQDIEVEVKRITEYHTEVKKIDDEILKLNFDSVSKKDIVTFKFVADIFGVSVDVIVKYFIVLLMLVFDPLAISLLLAYNTIIYKRDDNNNIKNCELGITNEIGVVNIDTTNDSINKTIDKNDDNKDINIIDVIKNPIKHCYKITARKINKNE